VHTSLIRVGKIRKPGGPSMATRAKAHGSGEWRAAVSRASTCRWVNPTVGDSGGTVGRRTCSAGEKLGGARVAVLAVKFVGCTGDSVQAHLEVLGLTPRINRLQHTTLARGRSAAP
jgi:hypothetical protein